MTQVPVVAYFPSDRTRLYQLLQWLPVLERLDGELPVAVVTRDPVSAQACRERTTLDVHLAPTLADLTPLYDRLEPRVVLYCNNSMRNFDSLLDARMLHVHIGHGESDKQSMASNNAKAYDRVLVAGEAAVQRHLTTLLEFDADRLVRIGRPQLDLEPVPLLEPTTRRTVLYAPTWEGDADYNDYTSVPAFGVEIVRAVLEVPDVRLVYKPHPKLTTSTATHVRGAHEDLVRMVAESASAEPEAGHRTIAHGDVLAVIPGCDAMITDVSSVGLDWLYLATDRPLFLTDPRDDADRLAGDVPVSRCADVIDPRTLPGLSGLLAARLAHDERRGERVLMRRHYFGDVGVGESTRRFVDEVTALVDLRDRLIGARAGHASLN